MRTHSGERKREEGNLVSVVVPTKNSEKTIALCLKSIKDQDYKKIEIIVVDNFSSDRTAEIASSFGRVFRKGPERSAQRNFGAKRSRGKYILFIDSDMELSPTVVSECVRMMEGRWGKDGSGVAGVVIPEISVGKGYWSRCKALEKRICAGDPLIEAPRFFRRADFLNIGGFDESLIASEDWDLTNRISALGKTARVQSPIYHHEGRLRLADTLRKKYYYGKHVSRYIAKHPERARKQFSVLRPIRLSSIRKGVKDPFHYAGYIVMKYLEFAAGAMGGGKNIIASMLKRASK